MSEPRQRSVEQSSGRADGGYVGSCTGCHSWYWNSWGHGTYCGSCLYGYSEALKDRWDDAEVRFERLTDLIPEGDVDAHDDLVEAKLLDRLERDGLLRDGLTATDARAVLDA
jgi:hypothetical protein